jgi:regulator of sigma E protease
MGVSEFSIGMGRPIVKTWARRKYKTDEGEEQETLFNIRAWPIGGFVKIVGMEPDEEGSERKVVGGFYTKSAYKRIVVLLAGPVFSLVFGWLILVGVFTISGLSVPSNRVAKIVKDQPAYQAGIKPGDHIVSINDRPITNPQEGINVIRGSEGKPLTFKVDRAGQALTLQVTPTLSAEEKASVDEDGLPTGSFKKQPQVGIEFGSDMIRPSLLVAMAEAANFPVQQVQMMVKKITQPQVLLNNSTGMVGMVVITGEAVQSGLSTVFLLSGMISLSLGIFNLLPLGMLDGGQIFLSIVELVSKKRVSLQAQTRFFLAGMAVIVSLFIFRFYKDMVQYVIPGKENLIIGTGKKDSSKPKDDKKEPTQPDSNAPVAPVK